ncbi:hypothetical protein DBR32_15525 [Taibaiella sp. KBW10]|uniref:cupin-like domain-containing protein n=1 Tax=Taibaiella sp. KBW10 TaxID=2153357 RepID=UPI000F592B03|nr:cupin-like domain-containing protein [Taibaiella sp. KBW10]RQO29667.1 hypothetical protein DBR32_15525 [Taibaiella sp. KBW10]
MKKIKLRKFKGMTTDAFEHYRATIDQPAIFENILTDWPAIQKWNLKYLEEQWGNTMVTACHHKGGEHRFDRSKPVNMYLTQLIENLSQDGALQKDYFLSQGLFVNDLEKAANDIATPGFFPKETLQATALWLAAEGTVTHLHWDSLPVLLGLVKGRKSVTLYDPAFHDSLYPIPDTEPKPNWSQVDFLRPDHLQNPDFFEVPSLEVELKAGELLYIPQYWWHHVTNLDLSIAVQFMLQGRPNPAPWTQFYVNRQAIRARQIATR